MQLPGRHQLVRVSRPTKPKTEAQVKPGNHRRCADCGEGRSVWASISSSRGPAHHHCETGVHNRIAGVRTAGRGAPPGPASAAACSCAWCAPGRTGAWASTCPRCGDHYSSMSISIWNLRGGAPGPGRPRVQGAETITAACQPRFAIFAGAHRGLGVHVSRVRRPSQQHVNLDLQSSRGRTGAWASTCPRYGDRPACLCLNGSKFASWVRGLMAFGLMETAIRRDHTPQAPVSAICCWRTQLSWRSAELKTPWSAQCPCCWPKHLNQPTLNGRCAVVTVVDTDRPLLAASEMRRTLEALLPRASNHVVA